MKNSPKNHTKNSASLGLTLESIAKLCRNCRRPFGDHGVYTKNCPEDTQLFSYAVKFEQMTNLDIIEYVAGLL